MNAKEVSIMKQSFNQNSERLKVEMLSAKDANKYVAQTFLPSKMFVSYLGHPISLSFEDLLNV